MSNLKAVQATNNYGVTFENLDGNSFKIRTQSFKVFKKIVQEFEPGATISPKALQEALQEKEQSIINDPNFPSIIKDRDGFKTLEYRWWNNSNINPLERMVNDGVQGFPSLFVFT